MKKHLKWTLPLIATVTNLYGDSTASDLLVSMNDKNKTCPAATQPQHLPSAVYTSCPAYTFDVFFTALIMQPSSSVLHYAAQAHPLPLPTPDWKIHDVKTSYDFGFDVGVGGNFHSANSNLYLDWERFHSQDSSHKTVPSDEMIGPFFEIGPDASPYTKARGHVTFHFDQVNLDFGQYVTIGNRLCTNLFAGITFARIKQTLNSKFSNASGTIVRTIHTPSTFTGAGPQLGFEFGYRIGAGFEFVGDAIGSFFVGPQKNHTDYSTSSPVQALIPTPTPNNQSTKVKKRTLVVPGFEGKLGLAYGYKFRKHYMFSLEAGYQAQVYLNAIQDADMGSEVNTPPVAPNTVGVYARTFQRNTSNFALAGPYINIDLGF